MIIGSRAGDQHSQVLLGLNAASPPELLVPCSPLLLTGMCWAAWPGPPGGAPHRGWEAVSPSVLQGEWAQGPHASPQPGWRASVRRLPGYSNVPSAVLLVLCRTDGHGQPRATRLWTVSDLDAGPGRGPSQRPASPFAKRMSAGRPAGELW